MKMILAVVAALAAAVSTPAVAASAPAPQDRVTVRETVRPNGTRVTVRERTTTTRRYGYDRPRNRWRTVCRTTYRYGERRRVCRRVRVGRY